MDNIYFSDNEIKLYKHFSNILHTTAKNLKTKRIYKSWVQKLFVLERKYC